MLDYPNWVAVIGSGLFTGAITYLVTRAAKQFDARGQAEAALIGIGPKIIEEQNERIMSLQGEVKNLWAELREARSKEHECLVQLREAEYHTRNLEQRIIALEFKRG